jgi:hypothetical protein
VDGDGCASVEGKIYWLSHPHTHGGESAAEDDVEVLQRMMMCMLLIMK